MGGGGRETSVSRKHTGDNALINAWIINSCNNVWIINSFYFEYRSPIRLRNNFINPICIFLFRNPNESDRFAHLYWLGTWRGHCKSCLAELLYQKAVD